MYVDLVAVVLLVLVVVLLVVLVVCVCKIYHIRKKKQIPRYIHNRDIILAQTMTFPHSDSGHTGEQPDSDPSSQVTGPIYSEITEKESKDPTYARVGVATGKYTYNITTNTSYDTVKT